MRELRKSNGQQGRRKLERSSHKNNGIHDCEQHVNFAKNTYEFAVFSLDGEEPHSRRNLCAAPLHLSCCAIRRVRTCRGLAHEILNLFGRHKHTLFLVLTRRRFPPKGRADFRAVRPILAEHCMDGDFYSIRMESGAHVRQRATRRTPTSKLLGRI
jgi:hypothetical protein